MWTVENNGGLKRVKARDETLRDGGQGEVTRSAVRGVGHLIDTCQWFDQATIGWIYTNPADKEVARYLREHGDEIAKKKPDFNKDKFVIYTLVHRGKEKEPEEVDKNTPFGQMLQDLKSGKQPYGAVNILSKARDIDLRDFGEDVTSGVFLQDTLNTMRLIKKANPAITLEFALEHFYTAWLEKEGQDANRKHIIDTLVNVLLEGNGSVAITAADTDGAHTPQEIAKVIHQVTRALQNDKRLTERGIKFDPALFIAHTHDDKENAAANVVAALKAGAGSFDCTVGREGERSGNATLWEVADLLGHPDSKAMGGYQLALEHTLGIRPDDKVMGTDEASCATGGMHAARLLRGLRKAQSEGHDYAWFVEHYRGSYATANQPGQKIQASLSPVGGAANVLFMLAGMGFDSDDKKDPRVAAVLEEVKNGEHERGMHYRGYNNANALLLLADTFGLRAHSAGPGGKPAQNKIQFSLRQALESQMDDGQHNYEATIKLSTGLEKPADAPQEIIRYSQKASVDQKYNDAFLREGAQELLIRAQKFLSQADSRFNDLKVVEARQFEAPVGGVRPGNGDPLDPQPEKTLAAAKLIFTAGTDEKFQANGVGRNYAEALGMAIQTMLEYKCFQIERERAKPGAGASPILDTAGIKRQPAALRLSKRPVFNDAGLGYY
jgi:hypothetical protein